MTEAQKEWLSFARGILPLGLFPSLVLAGCLPAHGAPCLRRTLVANVVDEKGNPVPNLSAGDFQAKFRGQKVKIVSATFDQQPRRIVILLDTSGSMNKVLLNRPISVFDVLRERISRSPSGDSFALATFADHFEKRLEFSLDPNTLEGQVRAIEEERSNHVIAKGRTALWDSVLAAIAFFGPPSPGDTLFLVSDGGNNASRHKPRDVQRALLEAGIRLFVFVPVQPAGSLPTLVEEEGPRDLREIVDATGGSQIVAVSGLVVGLQPAPPVVVYAFSEQLKAALGGLYRQMDEYHRLEVELTAAVKKEQDVEIKFADDKAARKKHWTLYYQRKIAPCLAAAVIHRQDARAGRGNSSAENYTPEARATTRNACCPEAEQTASDEKLAVELKR